VYYYNNTARTNECANNKKERVNITELKKARIERGIRQYKIAADSGISIRALQNYESGKRSPDVCTAQYIANILGVEVKDLFPTQKETSQNKSVNEA